MNLRVDYLIARPGANGPRYFWEPSRRLRAAGWRQERLATALGEAVARAEAINAAIASGVTPAAFYPPDPSTQRAGRKGRTAQPRGPAAGSLAGWIAQYQATPQFSRTLAASTRAEYRGLLRVLEDWAGDKAPAAITRADAEALYAAWMASSHSRANALLRMLRLLLQYCLDHGAVSRNVAAGLGLVKLPGAGRIVTQAQRDALLATARDRGEPNLALAILLGWYTGQRLGDLLGAGLDVATSNRLALRQSKTGAGVGFKLAPLLRPLTGAALARAVPGQVSLLVRDDQAGGVAFTDSTFNKAFVALRSAAAARHPGLGLEQVRFKDLRPTAITNLARAGASRAEISAVSGHSLRSIDQIMTDHYLILDDAMGDAAIDRLERWELSQLPTPPREELA